MKGEMKVRRVLTEALAELRRRGWCQHTIMDSQERVCAIGAIWIAMGWTPGAVAPVGSSELAGEVSRRVARQTGRCHLPGWNDAPGRKQAEVEQAFEDAITALDMELDREEGLLPA